jgi:hypothetical protein
LRYRKLDASGDMTFGNQQANFWRDVPEAPAQAIKTRLGLVAGEWYLDISSGTPYQDGVLGKTDRQTSDTILRDRILNTQAVTALVEYDSNFEPNQRTFEVACEVNTLYGEATIET